MHQGSSLTFFFRYYFPILFGGLLMVSVVFGDFTVKETLIIFSTVIIAAFPPYYLVLGKLRKVSARNDKLITETLNYEEIIEYHQINYISQTALTSPTLIKINYTVLETGQNKTFWALGSMSETIFRVDPFSLKELKLTKFIRIKVKESNPDYDEAKEPTRFLFPLVLMVVVLMIIITGLLLESVLL